MEVERGSGSAALRDSSIRYYARKGNVCNSTEYQ